MYLVKGPVNWSTLHQLTKDVPELPVWTRLTELPLRQLSGPKPVARVFYMPQQIPAVTTHSVRPHLAQAA
ncbi:MAG: hypothetical protein ACI84D_003261 [Thalassolituus oleivorans]|jgi:hypothetical protein